MNTHLQSIVSFIEQDNSLPASKKIVLLQSLKDADEAFEIVNLTLVKTETLNSSSAILLEKIIEELEQKRKVVEVQNRELEMESLLERVRTMAMGMRKQDDLLDICQILFAELHLLGFAELRNAMINIYDDDSLSFLNYDYSDDAGKTITHHIYDSHPVIEKQVKKIRSSNDAFSETIFAGKDLVDWRAFRKKKGEPDDPKMDTISTLFYYFYSIGTAAIGISTYSAIDTEKLALLKRFRNVFDFAYKRYTDIQNAEAQAREAQIELSLERVRAKTMAMHHSNELAETSSILFQQIKELGFETWSCGFCIWAKDDIAELWMGADSGKLLPPMMIPYKEELTHHNIYEAFLQKKAAHHKIWEGKDLERHYEFLQSIPSVKIAIDQLKNAGLSLPEKQCYYVGFFKQGYLLLITKEPNAALEELSKRFAAVFDGTYTRFLDLKKAEAQAREAQIEAALERVRSRTMAMQHSDELAEASFVLDSQIRSLGIQTRGCAFNIYKDNESTEWFSSAMGTMPTYKTPRENLFLRYYEAGKAGAIMHIESFEGDACAAHYNYLCTLPVMGDALKEMIASGGSFPVRQTDHVVYFKYGYLLFITFDPVPESHDIFIRFTNVFEQTYTRFLDLQKAEAQAIRAEQDLIAIKEAKQKAEEAFTELQATQRQLIQSEKMASLGELTAGIAHEIQNPLNFVNNFSELSNELMDEMNAEIEKGDLSEAKLIADDIKQNLEKITHHGKRADAIVKGMLQHSQSSSGKKEPTDINALADEYLRLAYHGLRAKDKSFNATLKTDFDESIGNINIIPQDIGRVILNLITNAFYAAPLPPKGGFSDPNYKHNPTVWVSTKKAGDKVFVSVRDNGPGIPGNIIDKIFQPFFTTKPTGQGTGLGLSLAYDIVKAHGGELKVETKEGEGTQFIIHLPKS